jgi:hypothetical protein
VDSEWYGETDEQFAAKTARSEAEGCIQKVSEPRQSTGAPAAGTCPHARRSASILAFLTDTASSALGQADSVELILNQIGNQIDWGMPGNGDDVSYILR